MKRVGVISNLTRDHNGRKTEKVISEAMDLGLETLVMPELYSVVRKGRVVEEKEFYKEIEGILVLGGDGTILQAARQAATHHLPIAGINFGNLGFLTEVEFSETAAFLKALKENMYYTEKRMMLDGALIRDGKLISRYLALNDIGAIKATFGRIIRIKVSVDQELIDHYSADGLLVSTPTGSTAYSLSAGGPIITPDMECLLITPICPHALGARSIIAPGNGIVKVEVMEDNKDVLLAVDGQQGAVLNQGDVIEVKKAKDYIELIRTNMKRNFFELIYKKLKERPMSQYLTEED